MFISAGASTFTRERDVFTIDDDTIEEEEEEEEEEDAAPRDGSFS
jgi:hypothetical protein